MQLLFALVLRILALILIVTPFDLFTQLFILAIAIPLILVSLLAQLSLLMLTLPFGGLQRGISSRLITLTLVKPLPRPEIRIFGLVTLLLFGLVVLAQTIRRRYKPRIGSILCRTPQIGKRAYPVADGSRDPRPPLPLFALAARLIILRRLYAKTPHHLIPPMLTSHIAIGHITIPRRRNLTHAHRLSTIDNTRYYRPRLSGHLASGIHIRPLVPRARLNPRSYRISSPGCSSRGTTGSRSINHISLIGLIIPIGLI